MSDYGKRVMVDFMITMALSGWLVYLGGAWSIAPAILLSLWNYYDGETRGKL